MFAVTKNSWVEILTPKAMVVRSGDLLEMMDHEGGALINGISTLIKEA